MPKQTTDVSGDPYGITYASAGLTWKIAKGVTVAGAQGGVISQFADSTLVNQGTLSSPQYGVGLGPATFGSLVIENKASGEIEGGQFGIFVFNPLGSLEINNAGKISGGAAGLFLNGSSDLDVENTGTIRGGEAGLYFAESSVGTSGPVVNNYGKIEASGYAILFVGSDPVQAKLVNHEGGVIKGEVAVGDALPLDLKNEGKIEGIIITGEYSDEIVNKGNIKGDVNLGFGVDTFKSKDGAKAGMVDTGDGSDLVVFADKADKLLFNSTLDAATNVDTVKNFTSGKDAIYLDVDIFTTVTPGTLSSAAFHKGTSAADADDRIIYDKASGALYYDPDGLGGLAQIQFARFDGGTKLKASDFTIGDYATALPL